METQISGMGIEWDSYAKRFVLHLPPNEKEYFKQCTYFRTASGALGVVPNNQAIATYFLPLYKSDAKLDKWSEILQRIVSSKVYIEVVGVPEISSGRYSLEEFLLLEGIKEKPQPVIVNSMDQDLEGEY